MREDRDPETQYNLAALSALRSALANGIPPARLGLTPEEGKRLCEASATEILSLAKNARHPLALANDSIARLGEETEDAPPGEHAVRALYTCQQLLRRRAMP